MKYKNLSFYAITIIVFSLIIYFVIDRGIRLETEKVTNFVPLISASTWDQFANTFMENVKHPLAILLLQVITIILVARIFGWFCKKIRQPTVIGEIAAGVFLGPSFVGMYFPEFSSFLFPAKSLGNLQFLSQIGLILFMFVIGMELDLKVLKNKAKDAVVISHASIIFPFALGITLAYFVYANFAPDNVKFLSFSLFMGIAMSITAFPVLARIVQERGLTKTRLGTIAITCAAADDITAWCLLAAVIAVVKAGTVLSALYTILMAVVYVVIMLKIVQPFFKRVGDKYADKESFSKPIVAIFFVTLVISSYATEVIGIHALFGAFMAGVIMPANTRFRSIFIEKVEDVSVVLLLPLFFVFTGLRTQIGLLNEPYLWKICLLIIGVAVAGKFLGSAIAAKFVGQSWRDSLLIGALMNTRGLMELVVLNIGYDLGVLSPEIFAMLVLMALATTFMTGPALDIINKFLPEKKEALVTSLQLSSYNILIAFSSPIKGVALLRLANAFVKRSVGVSSVTMLHLSPSNDLNQYNEAEYEKESFEPVNQEAGILNQPVITMFRPSAAVESDIIEISQEGNFDMLLIGMGNSVFEGTLLGRVLGFTNKIINPEKLFDTITGKESFFDNSFFDDRVKNIIRSSKIPLGIFIDKDIEKVENVFLPVFSISDSFLLIYAQKLIHNSNATIIILDAIGVIDQNPEMRETIQMIEKIAPQQIILHNDRRMEKEFLQKQDLMLISLDSWNKAVETQSVWLSNVPSVLIVKP
ncbi:cation/H(+) antiporter [Terrimonas sp.]|uniref:cation:proton antiporter n=1 Tax=Terrimonas sp. TaxID=1914338 RepID=UPI000D51E772|nr:cation:proton antiporter [Terrimonas sp.]PVD52958.1 cation/H(+) antiporter [Terrimonas sp.]